ncbi:MAG TPA: alkaline shock response membrane anchor protein AmaP [Bacillota bacterium]
MGVFDQIILAIYAVCLAAVSVLVALAALGWQLPLERFVNQALLIPEGRWATGILAALFFAFSVRLLRIVLRRRGPGQALVRDTELGRVAIALAAVENLVNRVGRQVEGVRDLSARVEPGDQGVRLHIRAAVAESTPVPDLTARLQQVVQQQVLQVVGVEVERVTVTVADIGTESRRRRLE